MPSERRFNAPRRPGVVLAGALAALTFLLQAITGQSSAHHITRRIDQRASASSCLADLQARNSAATDDIVRLAVTRAPAADYAKPLAELTKVSDLLRHLSKSCPQ